MKTSSTHRRDAVVGFTMLILSGALVLAVFSRSMVIGYFVGVIQTLLSAAIIGGGGDGDWD